MPAPIVLRTLTPETKKVENPPAGQPVIATKAELRDGSRPTDPVDPGADPHDWKAILTGTSGGTVDPAFDTENLLTYLGAFRVPFFANGSEPSFGSADAQAWTYKAPDGTNGPNGSMFLSQRRSVAEVQIPALSASTDHTQLNPTTVLQEFVDVVAKAPSGDANGTDRIGWMRAEGGRLYASTYRYYDGDGANTQNVLVSMDSANLATATYGGMFNAYTNDYGARYICDVPAEWQAAIGHTHLCGVTTELAIAGRASFGHSLIGLNLGAINDQTTTVPNTTWAHYPNGFEMNGFSIANGDVADYYASLVWTAGEYNLADWYQAGDTRLQGAGLTVDSTNLTAFCFLPIAETGRETTLHQLPLPDPSIRKHSLHTEMNCGVAFIPPGTDTVVFIGIIKGARYGIGYKHFYLEDGPGANYASTGNVPSVGGFAQHSKTDKDNFMWAMNLNDVVGRTNVYDPQHYKYTPLTDPGPFNKENFIISGHFDTATNKLYLVSAGYSQGSFNKQHVVSVYQVGAV